jgi:hypothetical protein
LDAAFGIEDKKEGCYPLSCPDLKGCMTRAGVCPQLPLYLHPFGQSTYYLSITPAGQRNIIITISSTRLI